MKVLESRRKDKELKERIKKRAERLNGNPHIMVCEECGSKLELREDEFKIKGDGFYSYTCPVCNHWNLIFCFEKWWGRLRRVVWDLFKDKEK